MISQLPAPGPAFPATRRALHAVAEHVVAPARVAATGNEIALEPAPGGFGTPAFPAGGAVRVEGSELVVDGPGGARREPLTTLPAAARLAGVPEDGLDPAPLTVDAGEAAALAALFTAAWAAVSAFSAGSAPEAAASEAHLWPEHFDVAIEAGDEAAGRRATYGVSPGDEEHAAPYAYVATWAAPPAGPGWNATAFSGAERPWDAFLEQDDAVAGLVAFFEDRRAALGG